MKRYRKIFLVLNILVTLLSASAIAEAEGNNNALKSGLDNSYIVYENDFEDALKLSGTDVQRVAAPTEKETYGYSARANVREDETGFIGTDYSLLGKYTEDKAVKKIKIEFDVLLSAKNSVSVRILDTQKNGAYLMSFGKDSLWLYENKATNTENLKKYANYSENTWYRIAIYLDTQNSLFDMYINGDEITSKTPIKADGAQLTDFMHWRLAIGKGNSSDAVYVDNVSYTIPYSCVYEKNIIIREFDDNGDILFKCLLDEDKALNCVMPVAVYENGKMIKIMQGKAKTGLGTTFFESGAIRLLEGQSACCFVWESFENLKPITEKGSEYSPTQEDYEALLEKWRNYYTYLPQNASEDADVRKRLENIKKDAQTAQNTMNRGSDINFLWGNTPCDSSHRMTYAYELIFKMALAWGSEGQTLYHDDALKEDIIYALSWMNENVYGLALSSENGWETFSNNDWWDWLVGSPHYLLDTLLLMNEEITKEQQEIFLRPYEYLCSFMRTDLTVEANVNSRAYNRFLSSVLKKDISQLRKITMAYPILFDFVQSGTGMYEDYSYLKHNMIPYNGFYGTGSLLERVVKVMTVTNSTAFELEKEYIARYSEWILNAFEPLMANGGIMNMVRGRGTDSGEEYSDASAVYASMLDMIELVDDSVKESFKKMLKRQLVGNAYEYAIANLTPRQILKLKSILNEDIVAGAYDLSKVYYNMDRVVHHKDGFSAGLSMSSERIATYESIDNCNKEGWYTSDGMLYVYNHSDDNPYGVDYFTYADPYKRPGTTLDVRERSSEEVPYGKEHFPNQSFVGGVSLNDKYTVAAMALESYNNTKEGKELRECDLTAKKAWFFFDDEIVALGSDIKSTDNAEVRTIIENKKMPTGNETFEISGNTAYIEGVGGYYFSDGQKVEHNRAKNGDFNFYEMWINHGENPDGEKYAYALLPNATKEQTQEYASKPETEILSNTENIQAVRENSLGVTGIIFWKAGTFGNMSVSTPMLVMHSETSEEITLCVSDPTQKLSEATLTINAVGEIIDCDSNIKATKGNGNTTFRIDFTTAKGKSLTFKIKK